MPLRLRCDVTEILPHGDHVYTVILRPETPVPTFRPGQFLHLALDPYNHGDFWPDSRAFSIASSPAERDTLWITYAVKGRFTTRMEAELQAGGAVWIKLPYGEFCIDTQGDACLVAGGTGITAFTAFLAGLSSDYARAVNLFYGARSPSLLIYRRVVEEAVLRCRGLRATFMAEGGTTGTDCLAGRLDPQIVLTSLPDPTALTYYVAGPPEMLDVFTRELGRQGISPQRIMIDAWE